MLESKALALDSKCFWCQDQKNWIHA